MSETAPLINRTLRLFLDSIGRREEYEFYLRKFQSSQSACFALVVPDDASVEASGDLMTFDLQFLLRLDLSPLLLLCGKKAEENRRRLEEHGEYRILNPAGIAGDGGASIREAVARHQVPAVCLPGVDLGRAVASLAPQVAHRVHLLRASGMLREEETGEDIFYWYTRRPPTIRPRPGDLPTLALAEKWLQHTPTLHISVSSPLYLLQEIFTVRGKGSIIRPGSRIDHHRGLEGLDREKLLRLIHEAFGRRLRDPSMLERASDVFLESRYRGAAILETHPAGHYLSKFTVGTQARGEGLAQELWEAACEPQRSLFWRSRAENPVNQWYERQADGSHRLGEWSVFWRGAAPERLPEIIRYAVERPGDFEEAGSSSR